MYIGHENLVRRASIVPKLTLRRNDMNAQQVRCATYVRVSTLLGRIGKRLEEIANVSEMTAKTVKRE
jgi:hypothetical protein